MKITINGKRYNTQSLRVFGKHTHCKNGNYSGTTYYGIHADGQKIVWRITNGQDLYLRDEIRAWDESLDSIDAIDMDDEQERIALENGLITLA